VGNSWGVILDQKKVLERLEWVRGDKLGFELRDNRLVLFRLADQSRVDKGRFVVVRPVVLSLGIYKKGLFEILDWPPGTLLKFRIQGGKLILKRK